MATHTNSYPESVSICVYPWFKFKSRNCQDKNIPKYS
jgi:hypothetical protein